MLQYTIIALVFFLLVVSIPTVDAKTWTFEPDEDGNYNLGQMIIDIVVDALDSSEITFGEDIRGEMQIMFVNSTSILKERLSVIDFIRDDIDLLKNSTQDSNLNMLSAITSDISSLEESSISNNLKTITDIKESILNLEASSLANNLQLTENFKTEIAQQLKDSTGIITEDLKKVDALQSGLNKVNASIITIEEFVNNIDKTIAFLTGVIYTLIYVIIGIVIALVVYKIRKKYSTPSLN